MPAQQCRTYITCTTAQQNRYLFSTPAVSAHLNCTLEEESLFTALCAHVCMPTQQPCCCLQCAVHLGGVPCLSCRDKPPYRLGGDGGCVHLRPGHGPPSCTALHCTGVNEICIHTMGWIGCPHCLQELSELINTCQAWWTGTYSFMLLCLEHCRYLLLSLDR